MICKIFHHADLTNVEGQINKFLTDTKNVTILHMQTDYINRNSLPVFAVTLFYRTSILGRKKQVLNEEDDGSEEEETTIEAPTALKPVE